ncbi:multidrug resistance protein, MATE family [Propionispira arboris]|uniref:Probable multidrug resistance protein NorM n=1 Tax=Propionispira arboris TaxID=84035 RepID=A0A1H6UFY2_9FIRM|nr:MATE family efflux transporter [Propionispira arboris]SEI88597.1 multidrug resistance protein, MATE family [Propionispira arboris]
MKQTHSSLEKIKQFFIVLLPIFITQISLISTGFFDTVMAGHVSEQDLAGVAVGANLFMPVFGSILGVISGLTPIISQLYGARKKEEIPFVIIQGLYLSVIIGIVLILLAAAFIQPVFELLNLEPRVDYIAKMYLTAMAFGVCPIFAAGVFRNFMDAFGYTRFTMLITICAVPCNIFMNYLFMFGKFGFPELGGIGAGVGTSITFYVVLGLNVLVVRRLSPFKEYHIFSRFCKPSLNQWKRQLCIGLPIGSAMFCEQSIFGAVGIFMTVYGTGVIAAHQAALNFTTMVYMIPLSISMTLTILVGFEIGAKRLKDAKKYSYMGVGLSMLVASTLAIVLIQFKGAIAMLYTNDEVVNQLVQSFIVYAIFLQVSDGVSAPIQGTLRGYKDVKITFFLAVLSYWVIGLPAGYILANYFSYGPYGYWMGLIIGIAVGAVLLGFRLRLVQRKLAG